MSASFARHKPESRGKVHQPECWDAAPGFLAARRQIDKRLDVEQIDNAVLIDVRLGHVVTVVQQINQWSHVEQSHDTVQIRVTDYERYNIQLGSLGQADQSNTGNDDVPLGGRDQIIAFFGIKAGKRGKENSVHSVRVGTGRIR